MEPSQGGSARPKIIQWFLDTRTLWPVPPKPKARDEVQELKTVASRALSLLPESEQVSVLKYYMIKDAKMSLASHLLKHLIITKYCNVPWSDSAISRDSHGKPIFIPRAGQPRIDFNVSHQAGIVSLIAAIGYEKDVHVGTDVVCVTERNKSDYSHIEKNGFYDWVDMHGDVFAESEVNHMKLGPVTPLELGLEGGWLNGYSKDMLSRCRKRNETVHITLMGPDKAEPVQVASNTVIDAKLRRFYAMWCLREAYVKMTGEALLAPWLKDLEMKDVEAPVAKEATTLEEGELKEDFNIIFKGKKVTDVKMELVALGADFMVAGAIRIPQGLSETIQMGKWKELDLERDVLYYGHST